MALKLRQGQVWKGADEFIRVVQLERHEVKYKIMPDLNSGKGEHRTSKKREFCRLIKGHTLLPAKGPEDETASPETNPVDLPNLTATPSEEPAK